MLENLVLRPSGRLKIFKTWEDGLKELVFEDDNLIVTSGKSIMLNQLYYNVGEGDPLSYAKVGTGGATDVDGNLLQALNVGMTDLFNPVATCSIHKSSEDTTATSITLLANVDTSTANGLFINEAGFFSSTGRMFNIKVFPRVEKKSSFSLNLEWVLKLL